MLNVPVPQPPPPPAAPSSATHPDIFVGVEEETVTQRRYPNNNKMGSVSQEDENLDDLEMKRKK